MGAEGVVGRMRRGRCTMAMMRGEGLMVVCAVVLFIVGTVRGDVEECSAVQNCGECVALQTCGWCDAEQTCMRGDVGGAHEGKCSLGFDWSFEACKDVCSSITACGECEREESCGFCVSSGQCMKRGGDCARWNLDADGCMELGCEHIMKCSECVRSPLHCSFCPGERGCVSADAAECVDTVCPTDQGEEAGGDSLAPITCIVV